MTHTIREPFDEEFDRAVVEALDGATMPAEDDDLLRSGLDSFDFIQLMMRLEDAFGSFWPIEMMSAHGSFTTVGRLRAVAREQLWTDVR